MASSRVAMAAWAVLAVLLLSSSGSMAQDFSTPTYDDITTGFSGDVPVGGMWPPHVWKYAWEACGEFNCGDDQGNKDAGVSGSIVELQLDSVQDNNSAKSLWLKLWFDGRYNGRADRERLIQAAMATQDGQMGSYWNSVWTMNGRCSGSYTPSRVWFTPNNIWMRTAETHAWMDMKVLEWRWTDRTRSGGACSEKPHGDKFQSPVTQVWREDVSKSQVAKVRKARAGSSRNESARNYTLKPELAEKMPEAVVELFTSHGLGATQDDVNSAVKQGYAMFGDAKGCRITYNEQGKPMCS